MQTFFHLELTPELIAPALAGKPQSGITTNEFKQLASELEVLVSAKTCLVANPPKELLNNKVVARMIRVHYVPRDGGFLYGIRDYVINPKNGNELEAIKEASFTSLSVWADFGPFKPYEK
jgi:hypothetical protein